MVKVSTYGSFHRDDRVACLSSSIAVGILFIHAVDPTMTNKFIKLLFIIPRVARVFSLINKWRVRRSPSSDLDDCRQLRSKLTLLGK